MEYKPYLPVLKWRQGEYQALSRLDKATKESIYPLFIVPPIEFDFEAGELKKTAQEHVEPLVRRLEQKWGKGVASIELHESLHNDFWETGVSIPEFVFSSLQSSVTNIQPSIKLSFDSAYIDLAIDYSKKKDCGLMIRLKLEELADSDCLNALSDFVNKSNIDRNRIDLVIDFGTKAEYLPYDRVNLLTKFLLCSVESYLSYRAIYLTGTTLNFSAVSVNSQEIQPREYWSFFERFYKDNLKLIPHLAFGDFTIESPEFAPSLDMRLIKPAARIIYSTDKLWVICKGSAFRDNPSQMFDMCNNFVYKSGFFMGQSFSNGDFRIYECANRIGSNGSLTTWKEAGISHHISLVVHQLANLNAQQTLP